MSEIERLQALLRRAAEVVLPAGFIASLAVYFGWVRTRKLYRELGVNQELLEYSQQDYILRSLSTFVDLVPLVAGLLVWAVSLHLLATWARRRGWRWLAPLVVALIVVLGIGVATDRSTSSGADLWFAAVFSVAAVAASITPRERWLPATGAGALAVVGVAGLLVVADAAYEAVRLRAEAKGIELALEAEGEPRRFACALVVGEDPLPLPDAEVHVDGERVLFVHGAMRVFTRSGGWLFVWPSSASPRAGLTAVDESRLIAFDLLPQRSGSFDCPSAETVDLPPR